MYARERGFFSLPVSHLVYGGGGFMKLIAGLGNPDLKYAKTFHNMGYMVIEALARELEIKFKTKQCKAITAHKFIGGEDIILAKPLTYMNLSGESIRELAGKYNLNLSDMLIIYDDFDIDRAAIRIRAFGSGGTHNGMKNIIECLRSTAFPRIRIGIGKSKNPNIEIADYVLSEISKSEYKNMFDAIIKAKDAAYDFVNGKTIDYIMQKYNTGSINIEK